MEQIPYRLIRSHRKTISIQIAPGGQVLVRCPVSMPLHAVQSFVQSKHSWIGKHLQKQQSREQLPPFTQEEIREFSRQARQIIPQRVAFFAEVMGMDYGRIAIRAQRSRWGSCSGKGNLNFNCLLVLLPPEILDYIVVHELCHRKEMNHSKQFWMEVGKILPDYKERQEWLKEFGPGLIGRLTNAE